MCCLCIAGLSLTPSGQLLFTAAGMKAHVQAKFHYRRTKFPFIKGRGDVDIILHDGDIGVYTRSAAWAAYGLPACGCQLISLLLSLFPALRASYLSYLSILLALPCHCQLRQRSWPALE